MAEKIGAIESAEVFLKSCADRAKPSDMMSVLRRAVVLHRPINWELDVDATKRIKRAHAFMQWSFRRKAIADFSEEYA